MMSLLDLLKQLSRIKESGVQQVGSGQQHMCATCARMPDLV